MKILPLFLGLIYGLLILFGGMTTVLAAEVVSSSGLAGRITASNSGKKIHDVNCASCHGKSGRGDGQAAASLNPKPTPYAVALKGKSKETVMKVISEGKGQMPGWSHVLSEKEISQIYDYISGFSKR